MGCSWIIWLFALATLKIEANAFENLHLQRILLPRFPKENKVAKCVLNIVDEVDKRITDNIEINIEAITPSIKQEFSNTVSELIANNNRSTFEILSSKLDYYKTFFRIYFLESLESLEYSLRENKHYFFPKDNFYVIVILPKGIPDLWLVLKAIFGILWNLSIINVNALNEDQNGIITVYTYFPFKEQHCKDSTPQVIDHYINGSFTFKTSHFPRKNSNFWNCSINVVAYSYHPFVYIQHERIKGFDGLVLEQLAGLLNFSVKVTMTVPGEIFDNQTYTGGFKMLYEGVADLMIGDIICTTKRVRVFGSCHYNTYYKNLVFRTDFAASSLNTLVLPFDLFTWLIILGLSIYKWFARPVWTKMTMRFKHQKETYNWFIIGPYIISFLILRSLYEGSIFKILHNRPIGVRPNNFDEAIQQGYKFMLTPESYHLHSIIPELKKHIVVVNTTNLTETFFQTEGKFAFLASKVHMAFYGKGRHFYMAPKPLMTTKTCMYMPKLSYITGEFNKRIEHMRQHGHIQKIQAIFSNIQPTSKGKSSKSQTYFSIKHLLGAFHMYFILVSISSFMFILEVLSKRYTCLRKALELFEKV